MPTSLLVPLVGTHHRGPPARQALAHFPSGTVLGLRPEPENPYDEKAIQVLVDGDQLPVDQVVALDEELEGTGFTVNEVMAMKGLQLGYVADSAGKLAAKKGWTQGNAQIHELVEELESEGVFGAWEELNCRLVFAADGQPMVEVGWVSGDEESGSAAADGEV